MRRVRKRFPEILYKKIQRKDGYDHYVIILDNKIVFRFPKQKHFKKLFRYEAPLLQFLSKRISIQVPVYRYVGNDFGGYHFIEGKSLLGTKKLTSTQRETLSRQIAHFLTQLHAVHQKDLKKFRIPERNILMELWRILKNKRRINTLPLQARVKIAIFTERLGEALRRGYKKALVHGDLSGDHILLDKHNALVGVIDFSDRSISDPARDFCFFWQFDADWTKSIYRHYRPKDKFLLERCKLYSVGNPIWGLIRKPQNPSRYLTKLTYEMRKAGWLSSRRAK